ncbi:hypothetical protein KAI04_01770 [Candidatus Pacearchaeota archaeon]|nr:hypothetical protein [Candidatus Pacearchaeota archaeon]
MKKQILLLIILLIILAIVVAGYFIFFNESSDSETIRSLESSEVSEINSLSVCQDIENNWDKRDCYEQVAVDNKDLSICDQMEGNIEGVGESSVKFCYAEVAGVTGDLFICDNEVPQNNIRDQCYWNVAVYKKDFSLCEGFVIVDNYACIIEVAIERKDISECDEFEFNDKKWCIQGVAYGTLDDSYCDLIEPSWSDDIQKCKDNVNSLKNQ